MPAATGLSGKKLTIATVASLLCVGGLLAYVLWVYGQLDRARDLTEVSWRSVATLLDDRYRTLERELAGKTNVQGLDEFSTIVDQFRTSSRRRTQQTHAEQAENWIAAHAAELASETIPHPDIPPSLSEAIVELNDWQAREQSILNSVGGRLLEVFLDFQQPRSFELAEW